MLKKNIQTNRGLIFVEILVVTVLIGILLIIVANSFGETRKQARDSIRLVHVQEAAKGLALYSLKTGTFPIATEVVAITGDDILSQELLKQKVIREVPLDPLRPDYTYYYISNLYGTNYILTYCLETDIFETHTQGCGNTITP